MATADTIRNARDAQPFQPSTLRLVDGKEYEVKRREWISVPPAPRAREILYYVPIPDDTERYQVRWIDLGLVAEVIVPSSAHRGSDGNGPG